MVGPEVKVPKNAYNPYGSTTGPFHTIGGWGLPAGPEHRCPKCTGENFKFDPGFAEAAWNRCKDCGYEEFFFY